jgi:hypothetical protein
MGEEITLIKIELDLRVSSVYNHLLAPRFAMDLVPDPRRKRIDSDYNLHLSKESNRPDDNSTATTATLGSLNAQKDFCLEFASFSGLKSNADKTTLLQIGLVGNLSDEIRDLGFLIKDKVKLLGMDFDRNLSSLTSHIDEVLGKINRIIEY